MQVNDALEPYAHAMHVSLRLIAGGLSMSKQIMALERGVHLVIATPGRLADLVRRGHADLSHVSAVVLDEADHMAEMGFMDEITEILAGVPSGGQRLLFSATLDGDVDRLISAYMHEPVLHDVTGGDAGQTAMTHVVLNVPPSSKYQIATRIAAREGRTIVFVRTKLATDRIADEMRASGVLAVSLHGDKSQVERNAAISGFRAGTVPVLVATDVAARGIHVDAVDLVLQLDPPQDPKDYTHRAGRTARAGAAGLVVTLVLPHQRRQVDRMLEVAGVTPTFKKISGENAEGFRIVDSLTGARQPSGIPVREPRVERQGRGRPERGGSRRSDAGPRRPHDVGRTRPQDDSVARERAAVERRSAELAERERALADRERDLAARESAARPRRDGANDADRKQRSGQARPHTSGSSGSSASSGSSGSRGSSASSGSSGRPDQSTKGARKGQPRPKKKR